MKGEKTVVVPVEKGGANAISSGQGGKQKSWIKGDLRS